MRYLLILTCFICLFSVSAQDGANLLADGNDLYEKKDYTQAEVQYRKKNAKSPLNTVSLYNLGNSIYSIDQHLEAKTNYKKVVATSSNKDEKYRAFHNLGNIYMKEKKYSQAVEAYKNALRNNPNDDETRYNYALAKQMLKDNPPPQDKEKKKDENKDDKEKKEDEKGKDKEDKDKGDKEKEEESGKNKESEKNEGGNEPNENQPEDGKFSKQRMESLLEAINNEEKEIQKKINKQKIKGKPIQQDKNW